ncbi:MAG: DUF4198 domain-containing protein [Candidatus Adiutrix sp.]|jgi:uncharacterized GH25 family protein|nr:DUF4198 domain-containing protein [Candidatus Adiutrix sp.]
MRCRFVFVLALLLLSLTVPAQAHEWLLKAAPSAPKKGDKVKIELMATHYFNRSEEAEAVQDAAAQLIQNGQTVNLEIRENPDKDALDLMAEFVMPADGTAWIAGHRLAQTWSVTPDGYVPGTKADVGPEKAAQIISTSKTEKFVKLLLNPSPNDETFAKPLGHLFEIIPLDNPAGLKVGGEIRVKAVYDGKPLVTPIYATYTDFSGEMMTFAFYTESTEAEPKVKFSAPGLWLIRARHTVKLPGDVDYNTMAILMFEVK